MNTANNRTRKRSGYGFKVSSQTTAGITGDPFEYCLQVASSVGLETNYNHSEIEILVNVCPRPYSHPILEHILYRISQGEKFAEGDTITVSLKDSPRYQYKIRFTPSGDSDKNTLRAVVLDMEEKFQSLSTKDALRYIQTTKRDI